MLCCGRIDSLRTGGPLCCASADTQIKRCEVPVKQAYEPFADVACEPEIEEAMTLKEEAMTLQIGLIGASGFVIASDRLVQKQQYLNLKTPMHSSRTKKIQVFLEHGLVLAYAGQNPPTLFGYKLRDAWGTVSSDETVRRASDKWFQENPTCHVTRESEIIIGHVGDAMLWHVSGVLNKATVMQYDKDTVMQYDKAITRNSLSLAPFLTEHFYDPNLPISTLETLAALTIWYGERQGNTTIRGLDGVTCENGIIEEWSAEKIAKMNQRCELIHARIKAAIVES